jgi:hypothetical protein
MIAKMNVGWNPILKRHDVGSSAQGAAEFAAWVRDDLSQGQQAISSWIEKVNAVAEGETPGGYLGSGNAHHIMAMGELVYLECEYVEEMKVLMTRTQLVKALRAYAVFITEDIGHPHQPPPAFDVEYEASGEEARELYLKTGGKLGYA